MTKPLRTDENLVREQRFSSALQQLLGYRLVEWEPDRAVFEYQVAPEHLNRTNRLHGGIIAVLCDTAAGYAGCYCETPGEARSSVTLSLTLNFVAPASRGRLRAEGRKTGGGRRIFFAEAEVRDAEGRLIATASGTFRYVSDAPVNIGARVLNRHAIAGSLDRG
jgi:uncharacterized protein (TIGR00369 family)